MFKDHKFELKIDAENVVVHHRVRVSENTIAQGKEMVDHIGKTAMLVIAAAAVAKTASDVVTHIVKTQIK